MQSLRQFLPFFHPVCISTQSPIAGFHEGEKVTMNTRILLAVSLSLAAFACGGKDEKPPQTPPNGMAPHNGNGPPGADPMTGGGGGMVTAPPPGGNCNPSAPPGTPGACPPATGPTPPPAGNPPAGGGGTCTPVDANAAAAASGILGTVGNTEAPGAGKEGNTFAGNCQAGQTLEQTFTMQPGKCYTIVGTSMGITQLDANVSLVSLIPNVPGMQVGQGKGKSGMAGSQVVVGSKGNCLKLTMSPIPVQAKVTVTAAAGSGLAAAQIFVK
jgi:hypothetical protein